MAEQHNTERLVAASRPPKRPPHLVLGLIVGALIGFTIGALLVIGVNDPRITGSRTNVFTFLFGLPGLLSVPGAVFGSLASIARYANDADAPVSVDERGRPVVHPEMASTTAEDPEPGLEPRAPGARPARRQGEDRRPAARRSSALR
jgi:hypothetical protein